MPLIVEDGTGVANAQSYWEEGSIRIYASSRGVSLPSDETAFESLVLKAMDYLESLGLGLLSLTFPFDENSFSFVEPDQAFVRLRMALAQLCIEQSKGFELQPTSTGKFIIEDKVGPLTTKYSEKLSTSGLPSFPAVDSLINTLIKKTNSGFALTVLRV